MTQWIINNWALNKVRIFNYVVSHLDLECDADNTSRQYHWVQMQEQTPLHLAQTRKYAEYFHLSLNVGVVCVSKQNWDKLCQQESVRIYLSQKKLYNWQDSKSRFSALKNLKRSLNRLTLHKPGNDLTCSRIRLKLWWMVVFATCYLSISMK